MLLVESVLEILFLSSNLVEPDRKQIEEGILRFDARLKECTSLTELKEVIKFDFEYMLPVQMITRTFERYLELDRTNPNILKLYAEYIEIALPQWKSYAKSLLDEANKMRH